MPKLNAQLIILAAAAQRYDRLILPLPNSLKLNEKQVTRTLDGLTKTKLIVARPAAGEEPVWRKGPNGERQTLVITPAGLAAIGCEDEPPDAASAAAPAAALKNRASKSTTATSGAATTRASNKRSRSASRKPSRGKTSTRSVAALASTDQSPKNAKHPTKVDAILALLQRRDGAVIEEMTAATGWQAHSVRAALTGLRKRGIAVTREKHDGVTRYRVAA